MWRTGVMAKWLLASQKKHCVLCSQIQHFIDMSISSRFAEGRWSLSPGLMIKGFLFYLKRRTYVNMNFRSETYSKVNICRNLVLSSHSSLCSQSHSPLSQNFETRQYLFSKALCFQFLTDELFKILLHIPVNSHNGRSQLCIWNNLFFPVLVQTRNSDTFIDRLMLRHKLRCLVYWRFHYEAESFVIILTVNVRCTQPIQCPLHVS
jgi:hypothetical protein